ncbi:MAG: sulfatase-like hydrolase/transferase [Clostridia bacterium]|nr:sulfatase-like hydrolase/transferase [Clostridia bacterium]
MKDRIVLLTKDALGKFYLPTYGNKDWDMPNLKELAEKGTVFNRFYTAAPSTAMSFIGMFTQLNAYETEHRTYVPVTEQAKDTVFDKLYEKGYDCQIIWDEKWISMAKRFSECYGEHTKFNLLHINQSVGRNNMYKGDLNCDDALAEETMKTIEGTIEKITSESKDKLFLWIHLPHVLLGRNCYGSDLDLLDRLIGFLREHFSDDAIYVSADHGNMNGAKGKIGYGFDVYEPAICIPLISPRINELEACDVPVGNVHIYDIMQGIIPEDEFVYCDCAYYGQLHRKLALIRGNFKYIYNKEQKTEELYDLAFDPNENCNIVTNKVYDVDRKLWTPLNQVYYYPDWDKAEEALKLFRAEKDRIWRQESGFQTFKARIRRKLGRIHMKMIQNKAKKKK